MTIHEDAIDLIMWSEGCQNVAYACPAHVSRGGKHPYLTIGYGHTGPDVTPGLRITTAKAREMLVRDLANVETFVRSVVRVGLRDFQIGALCSLVYNIGADRFVKSNTLRMLNAAQFGDFDFASVYMNPPGAGLTGMAREWAEFRLVTGRGVMRGLVKRRAAELELFFTGAWTVPEDDRLAQSVENTNEQAPDMLRPGARSSTIKDLHDALAHVGFPVTCGDAYTWVTSEAVKQFQIKYGLTPDGIYGPETARKLGEIVEGGGAV